jgi:hypothetical protein
MVVDCDIPRLKILEELNKQLKVLGYKLVIVLEEEVSDDD